MWSSRTHCIYIAPSYPSVTTISGAFCGTKARLRLCYTKKAPEEVFTERMDTRDLYLYLLCAVLILYVWSEITTFIDLFHLFFIHYHNFTIFIYFINYLSSPPARAMSGVFLHVGLLRTSRLPSSSSYAGHVS